MRQLNAEILAVGSELLTPTKIDTNSLWLTEQLNALGVEVVAKSIVGDERALLTEMIRTAIRRSGLVILTGGLGPTEDDVTRDAVGAALGRGLEFRQELLDAIAARFARMGRGMAENNRRQAFLVEGAEVLPNDRGTAPGQWIDAGQSGILLLPGPPREMKAMFELQCLPRLQQRLPAAVLRTRFYRVSCIGESDLDQLIAPVYTAYTNPATTILAGPADIQVHLRARCATAEEAEALLAELGSKIEQTLGDRLYTRSGESLEEVVGQMLRRRGEKIAVAESMTGGLLGERLTAVPGSSDYFLGGILAYTDQIKSGLLGVDPGMLAAYSAVSEPVAKAMAAGVRERLGSDWAVAVTGYAGPGESSDPACPTGTVFIAIAGEDGVRAERLAFSGERGRIRHLTSTWALDLLRRRL